MKRSKRKKGLGIVIVLMVLAIAAGALWAVYGKDLGNNIKQIVHPLKYVEQLKKAADEYGLDRSLVAAVIATESGYDREAVSPVGAVGLMQVMPETAQWIAAKRGIEYRDGDLFDVSKNLDYGCWFLRFLLDRYDGSERNALTAYNAGHNRTDEWLKQLADENGEIGEIPFEETRNYVNRVLRAKKVYGEAYANELG
ncbi:MAG: lytic transglycosylase domain-containing protein [Clostridia bacterium]|nr:lytic transglycosylase domain-containing protein [Clostridia bacterium]